MTAEIVVMNLNGIGLAADSAGLLTNEKINNNMNKLFMLAPGHNVGLMIYNRADFMGIPWEIIINDFRDKLISHKIQYDTLEEYGDEFIAHIKNHDKKFANPFFEEWLVYNKAESLYRSIRSKLSKAVINWIADNSREIPKKDFINFISDIINDQKIEIDNMPKDQKWIDQDLEDFKSDILNKFSGRISDARNSIIQNFPLTSRQIKTIDNLIFDLLLVEINKYSPDYSGIVIAGFGSEDLYPKFVDYRIAYRINSQFRYSCNNIVKIDFNTVAHIEGFAQDDIFNSILYGRHPHFISCLIEEFQQGLESNNLDQEQKSKIINGIINNIDRRMRNSYTKSIYNVVNHLPKDELAKTAETLVNLTVFMRHVQMMPESVAAPIDVAVISKKDGFVWIKRKHYFDISYNYHFNK